MPSQSLYRLTFDDFCDWYAEAIKPRLYDRRRGRGRDRARGAGAAAQAAAPGHAARDRGDLVEPARARVEADRRAVARAATRALPPTSGALDRVQEAAADLPPKRCARRARGRRAADLLGGGQAGAGAGERERGGRARAAAQGDRARGGDAGERALRRERAAQTSSPASARSSSATGASSMHSVADNVSWIEALSPWPEEFGLGRMRQLLAELGDPQDAFRAIHVVGTKGRRRRRGCARRCSRREGKRVGAYTSPHVTGWAERIQVDGEPSRPRSGASARVRAGRRGDRRDAVRGADRRRARRVREAGVDVAVVEAGLGGRLDATNVLDAPSSSSRTSRSSTPTCSATRARRSRARSWRSIRPGATVVLGEPEWEGLAREAGAARVVVDGPEQPRARASPRRRRSSAGRSIRAADDELRPGPAGAGRERRSRSGTARTTSAAWATSSRAFRPGATSSSRRSSRTRTSTGCSRRSRRSATRSSRRASSNSRALGRRRSSPRGPAATSTDVETVADPREALGSARALAGAGRRGPGHRLALSARGSGHRPTAGARTMSTRWRAAQRLRARRVRARGDRRRSRLAPGGS